MLAVKSAVYENHQKMLYLYERYCREAETTPYWGDDGDDEENPDDMELAEDVNEDDCDDEFWAPGKGLRKNIRSQVKTPGNRLRSEFTRNNYVILGYLGWFTWEIYLGFSQVTSSGSFCQVIKNSFSKIDLPEIFLIYDVLGRFTCEIYLGNSQVNFSGNFLRKGFRFHDFPFTWEIYLGKSQVNFSRNFLR